MKNRLYKAYTDNIQNALNSSDFLKSNLSASSPAMGSLLRSKLNSFTGSENNQILNESSKDLKNTDIGIETLKNLLGIVDPLKISTGDHPDFQFLRDVGGKENSYIVSCFIDVRKSTNLFKASKNYNHDQIASVIQTIQAAAIHTCSLFNGHIQRLQYDGVFVYFGGRNYPKQQAIIDSINASSFFSYFIKYELPDIFEQNGIDEIYTKIGIDFGDDEDVSWYVFGLPDCSELTTLSLHTSLAPKMQAFASQNGIVVGNNMLSKHTNLNSYSSVIKDYQGSEKRYIYTDPNYAQWKFDWENYLENTFEFVKKDDGGIFIDYDFEINSRHRNFENANQYNFPDEKLFNIAKSSRPYSCG